MSRYLEFILSDDGDEIAANSDNQSIRNADKIGFAVVDNKVSNVNGMDFIRQQVASRNLVDGEVFMVACRYNETVDPIKPPTAARTLNKVTRPEAEAAPEGDAPSSEPGADANAEGARSGDNEESDEIPF